MKAKLRTMLLSCLALLLVLGMTGVVCAYDVSCSDVPEDSWFYTDVMTLAESGVIGGYPDGTYRPTKKVTTGEALKMILLAAGYPEPEPAASHWARGYLNFAIEQGFLTRYEDISDLDVNMTRGLVAKLAANALGLSDPGTYGTFTDTDSPYVEALCAAGIVGRYPDGPYRPGASLSRAAEPAAHDRADDRAAQIQGRLPRHGLLGLFPVFHRLRQRLHEGRIPQRHHRGAGGHPAARDAAGL